MHDHIQHSIESSETDIIPSSRKPIKHRKDLRDLKIPLSSTRFEAKI
jgi:hypothetical protein